MSKNSDADMKKPTLVWTDLEMTGLNPDEDFIIEIASIITDSGLNLVAKGPEIVVHQKDHVLDKMDDWNKSHHGKSGLTEKVRKSPYSCRAAEEATLNFIKEHVSPGKGILAGNSIWQDRRFIIKHMPELDKFLHYRMLDVSSVKILKQAWYSGADFPKKGSHRAMDDIEESINELKFYRKELFR